jgi:hypothetical protein
MIASTAIAGPSVLMSKSRIGRIYRHRGAGCTAPVARSSDAAGAATGCAGVDTMQLVRQLASGAHCYCSPGTTDHCAVQPAT